MACPSECCDSRTVTQGVCLLVPAVKAREMNYTESCLPIYLCKDFTEFLAELSLLREYPWLDPVSTSSSGAFEASLQTELAENILCAAPEP